MIRTVLLFVTLVLASAVPVADAASGVIELTASSAAPGRSVELCVYRPDGPGPFPVVVFSQDLGASCHANADLGRHWAQHRVLGVFVAHPGGASVDWTGRPSPPRGRERPALAREARIDDRAGDVRGVLDALAGWNREAAHPLAGAVDLDRTGVAGAFWGAYTAEVMTGRRPVGGPPVLADRRIRAALMLDPVGPGAIAPPSAYSAVRTPWMLIWGWRGSVRVPVAPEPRGRPGGGAPAPEAVWQGLRVPGSYELVFRDALAPLTAYHREPRRDPGRNAGDRDHIVRELTTAYWKATLNHDADARRWLNGPAARDLLGNGDRWRHR
ncbi:hypothetical protein HFP89_08400 [Wenzhouxiangella sp. XN79A]|uniref:alpha/beta hydrolase family protein n=1 Tax=Wenzhouxiangella sp. XN79A TaxID=2724193 RepID=UPI00144ACDF4|nr:hypothetical protein [Wenzhouxiangella sp. XN79A]NKI35185.1 hypothetical protein [Wenzhouxiangella sp. XN79A]